MTPGTVDLVHEVSLCRSVAATVERHAAGRTVEVVRLRIGHLRQVVPDLMARSWDAVVVGSPLAGSTLLIDEVPLSIHCRGCGATTVLDRPALQCGQCGGRSIDIVTGEEFLVESIDVAAASERV